jgi:hypothetical protein
MLRSLEIGLADAQIAAVERELAAALKKRKGGKKEKPAGDAIAPVERDLVAALKKNSKAKTSKQLGSRSSSVIYFVAVAVLLLAALMGFAYPGILGSQAPKPKRVPSKLSAPTGRRDAAAENRIQALMAAKKEACPTCPRDRDKQASEDQQSRYWSLVFDTTMALYEYRRLDEALKELLPLLSALGGATRAKQQQPLLGPFHAVIVGALAAQKGKSTDRAMKMARSAKTAIGEWRGQGWKSHYAGYRPYAMEVRVRPIPISHILLIFFLLLLLFLCRPSS